MININCRYTKLYKMFLLFLVLTIVFAQSLTAESRFNSNTLITQSPEQADAKIFADREKSLEAKVSQYMKAQPVRFIENKGQLRETSGLKIFFQAEIPGMRVLITEKGLTYLYVKIRNDEEEERRERKKKNQIKEDEKEKATAEMSWINVTLDGATIKAENVIKEGSGPTAYNYIYAHCATGIYGVHDYEKITIKDVYPKIDWVIYNSSKGGMKYDFVVHPGADAGMIKLHYEGAKPLKLNKDGSLDMRTKLGKLEEARPYCYMANNQTEIASQYQVTHIDKYTSELSFEISDYDHNAPLIIDPELAWGTFFGGDGADGLKTINTDADGNIFVSGYMGGTTDMPLLNFPGSYFQSSFSANVDAFALKFSNSGVLLWATYFGGNGIEQMNAIKVDPLGNVYMVGLADSSDFPIQNLPGAYNQASFNGGNADALILKFSNSGVLLWSTYFGGSSADEATSIGIDIAGNVYVAGYSGSSDFPAQNLSGAYNQPFVSADGAGFIAKFSGTGALLWSTSYGGSNVEEIAAIALDGNNNLWVAGQTASTDLPVVNSGNAYVQATFGGFYDSFFAKFNSTGALVWSTYYGGSIEEDSYSIAADALNNVYITGLTSSPDFSLQTLPGAFNQSTPDGPNDVFLIKFDTNCSRLWCTLLGGNDQEDFSCINNSLVIDDCNNLYLMFTTFSTNINTTAYQTNCNGFNDNTLLAPNSDFLLMFFLSTGELKWSTLIGGDGGEFRAAIAIDKNNNLFLSGEWTNVTDPSTYPLANPGGGAYFDSTPNGGGDDGYIMKFVPAEVTYSQSKVNSDVCGNCNGKAEVTVLCGQAPYTFAWSNGVVESNVSVANSSISSLCPGNYSVNVSWGCTNDTAFLFVIEGTTAVNITASSVNGTCGQPNGTASATANGGSGTYAYSWSNGATGNFISGLTSGSYSVVATDQNGCSATSQVIVSTAPAAGVTLTASDTILGLNETAVLEIIGGDTYNWSPNTGLSCVDCFSVIASPSSSTTYTVTGTDTSGCPYLRVINVLVDIVCNELFVPNIFSPNGIGNAENEKLCVYSNCVKSMNLGIYNRWGELIYSTDDQTACWDGTYKGEPAMTGVYSYRLSVEQFDGEKIEKSGVITLTK